MEVFDIKIKSIGNAPNLCQKPLRWWEIIRKIRQWNHFRKLRKNSCHLETKNTFYL